MKAYVLGLYSNSDAGNELVFAKDSKEAKKLNMDLEPDSYIDLYANRAPHFDDMENYSHKEIMREQWREGWWFDIGTPPSADNNVPDEAFYDWYDKVYGEVVAK